MFYSDHEFEGEQGKPCEYEKNYVERDPTGQRIIGTGVKKCGADWTSVLHPPDQFRHWCSICEAGGDHD